MTDRLSIPGLVLRVADPSDSRAVATALEAALHERVAGIDQERLSQAAADVAGRVASRTGKVGP